MTTYNISDNRPSCSAKELLKMFSGKWKAQIFRIATEEPVRFNSLRCQLDGSNKQ